MKATKRLLLVLTGMILTNVSAFADDAVQQAATSQFNSGADWIISMITGPIGKIVGAVFLLAAVGQLIKKEVIAALLCGIAFLILVFMPQILSIFPKGN